MGAIFQPHTFECLQGLCFVGHAVEVLREHHVFQRREVGNQVKLLEYKTNLLGAKAVQLRRRHLCNIHVVDPNLTLSGLVEAANQVHQRRLA